MVWLVGVVGALREAGLANRLEVGIEASLQLTMVLLTMNFLDRFQLHLKVSDPLSLMLIVGSGTCLLLAIIGQPLRLKNPRTGSGIFMLALAVALTGFARQTQEHITTRQEALSYAEGGFLENMGKDMDDNELTRLLSIIPHLSSDGGPLPNPEAFEKAFLERDSTFPQDYYARTLAHHAPHLLTESDLSVAKDYDPSISFGREIEGRYNPMRAFLGMLALERERPLTGPEAALQAERALQNLPNPASNLVLKDLHMRWSILDHLGDPSSIQELAPAVERSLLATWTGSHNKEQAGFSATDSSDAAGNRLERSTVGYMDDTDFAISLMAEFGVPKGIELDKLHAYLVRFSSRRGSTLHIWTAHATALRSRLESLPTWKELHPPSAFDRFNQPGKLLTALALALFGIFITLRAPRTVQA